MLVYMQTNESYYHVDYYLDETWIGSGWGGSTRTDDFFWYDDEDVGGSVKGTKHKLKVVVYYHDENSNLYEIEDTVTFRVYKPVITSGYAPTLLEKPNNTGAYGWAEVSAHYFNGTDFVMEAYAYFDNRS